jgi:hypothetical protein
MAEPINIDTVAVDKTLVLAMCEVPRCVMTVYEKISDHMMETHMIE